ncbi:putative quinol monooxygenase [Sutterella sp.]|uniref:putative quinol monooxygenase n=1 Tax=Sutterella sp. TaxID=1981025 RepID=UPI0026DF8DA4|nr:antibiotic biosynthesis monooxygenase [Sutterella sp.]MDO5531877.1 antibiotic biosynthesis monooxygenase [Sutterella sp.]
MRTQIAAAALGAVLALGLPATHAAVTPAGPEVRMAEIHVKPGCLEKFLAAVTENMRASVEKEPGVISIYSVASKEDPAQLTFFEIYADHEAYITHTRQPHFRKYIETTKDLTDMKRLIEVDAVGLFPAPRKR